MDKITKKTKNHESRKLKNRTHKTVKTTSRRERGCERMKAGTVRCWDVVWKLFRVICFARQKRRPLFTKHNDTLDTDLRYSGSVV